MFICTTLTHRCSGTDDYVECPLPFGTCKEACALAAPTTPAAPEHTRNERERST